MAGIVLWYLVFSNTLPFNKYYAWNFPVHEFFVGTQLLVNIYI